MVASSRRLCTTEAHQRGWIMRPPNGVNKKGLYIFLSVLLVSRVIQEHDPISFKRKNGVNKAYANWYWTVRFFFLPYNFPH